MTQECYLSIIKDLWLNRFVDFRADKQAHESMCILGANWLLRNHKCKAIIVERGVTKEKPDVLGYSGLDTYLIESKASRSDFLSDAKKSFRKNPEQGMGKYRWYICPKDMIKESEIPDGWGLLYVSEKGRIRKVKDPEPFDKRNKDAEYLNLVGAVSVPWKLFQHWSDDAIRSLTRVRWMSRTTETDVQLFCARMMVHRSFDDPTL